MTGHQSSTSIAFADDGLKNPPTAGDTAGFSTRHLKETLLDDEDAQRTDDD